MNQNRDDLNEPVQSHWPTDSTRFSETLAADISRGTGSSPVISSESEQASRLLYVLTPHHYATSNSRSQTMSSISGCSPSGGQRSKRTLGH